MQKKSSVNTANYSTSPATSCLSCLHSDCSPMRCYNLLLPAVSHQPLLIRFGSLLTVRLANRILPYPDSSDDIMNHHPKLPCRKIPCRKLPFIKHALLPSNDPHPIPFSAQQQSPILPHSLLDHNTRLFLRITTTSARAVSSACYLPKTNTASTTVHRSANHIPWAPATAPPPTPRIDRLDTPTHPPTGTPTALHHTSHPTPRSTQQRSVQPLRHNDFSNSTFDHNPPLGSTCHSTTTVQQSTALPTPPSTQQRRLYALIGSPVGGGGRSVPMLAAASAS